MRFQFVQEMSGSFAGRRRGAAWLAAASAVFLFALFTTSPHSEQRAEGAVLPTPGFHHLHLNTSDPDRTIAFYTRYFPTTSKVLMAGLPALKAGHVYLLFNKVSTPPASAPQSAFWHFGFAVLSAREYWAKYQASGAPLAPLYTEEGGTAVPSEWWPGTMTKAQIPAARARGVKGQATYGFLRGPDDVTIEFAGENSGERLDHVHMYQEHVFCAETWYQRHLQARVSGFALARRPDEGRPSEANCRAPNGEPSWLALAPEGTIRRPAAGVAFGEVEMNWYPRQGNQPLASSLGQSIDHVGLRVSNLQQWLTKLRREGVRILREPYRLGDGHGFLVEGPSREVIEIVDLH
jgi:catechol 2,3-dioxygenase-like lactoylglutathione lyase family enzyme